jgi:hypothetical protein
MGLFDWLKGKPAAKQGWKVGDRVLAKWDAFFYPGRVRSLADANCEVAFDDGDVAWVPYGLVLAPDIRVGSKVFGRIKGGPHYLPGTVSEQKGETIQIRYDHGEEEWTSISFVRVERGGSAGAPQPPMQATPPVPQKQNVDLGEPLQGTDWRVGDRVFARWLDFYWYPGTILGLGEKGIHILYDDGDQRIVQEAQLMPLVVEEGEEIFIRPKNQSQLAYTPATVSRVRGETIDVTLEDGTEETNTKVSRARFWRCPVGIGSIPFDEGQRVLAFDSDECLYPAEIVTIEDDRIIVQYLDGPERMLTPELLRKFDLRAGAKIECRWKGGPNYFAGTLAKVEGERVFIQYDDGDEEWTSIRLVRIPRAPA